MKNQKSVVFTDRSINILLKDLRKIKALTSEEEKDALERLVQHDKRARKSLINSNLLWVLSKAKQYAWCGMEQRDLFQVGTIGLIQAVDKYDPTKGECFRAYAKSWVEGELLKAVKDHTRNAHTSLEDAAYPFEDCKLTLEEVLPSGSENNADMDVRQESLFNAMKAEVKVKFFADGANLWEDSILMKEKGYTLSDVAKKHHVSEEKAKEKLKEINEWLRERYDFRHKRFLNPLR